MWPFADLASDSGNIGNTKTVYTYRSALIGHQESLKNCLHAKGVNAPQRRPPFVLFRCRSLFGLLFPVHIKPRASIGRGINLRHLTTVANDKISIFIGSIPLLLLRCCRCVSQFFHDPVYDRIAAPCTLAPHALGAFAVDCWPEMRLIRLKIGSFYSR